LGILNFPKAFNLKGIFMSLSTNLHGRLRNTSLPQSHGLMPLYEAVVNAIHAIEEAGLNMSDGLIDVEIRRSPQYRIDFDKKKKGPATSDEIIGFTITDNGIGFNDVNMKSFETLDSEHKAKNGGRGVGRLLWLKAFEYVKIDSIYESDENKTLKRRTFSFDMVSYTPDFGHSKNQTYFSSIFLEVFLWDLYERSMMHHSSGRRYG
jgi:hypothetical protein